MAMTLEELSQGLDKIPQTEREEGEYRRGYYDGFLQAIEAFYSSGLSKEKAYDALCVFLQNELFQWSRNGNMKNRAEFPPIPILIKK